MAKKLTEDEYCSIMAGINAAQGQMDRLRYEYGADLPGGARYRITRAITFIIQAADAVNTIMKTESQYNDLPLCMDCKHPKSKCVCQ
jgi:hypothetical protein